MKRNERRAAYVLGLVFFPAATLLTRWHFAELREGTAHASDAWLSPGQALVALLSTVLFAVAMEYYARYAHEHWWHGDALWFIHRTHHEPRTTLLEANDVFGVLNAAVVMPVLMQAYFAQASYGAALRLGASLGISIFGCAYIVVHDGVHHERFWSWPLRNVEWFHKISEAHRAHHKKDHTAPFGLFLGPEELDAIRAGKRPPSLPTTMRVGLCCWTVGLLATSIDTLAQPA
jgi:beta-carotene 3-hydroxylase